MSLPIFDATSKGTANNVSSITIAHTCTGSNLEFVSSICWGDNSVSISGATFNGVALTRSPNAHNAINSYSNDIWRLTAPATGTHNLVVTFSGTMADYVTVINTSYTNAAQSGQPDSSNAASNASASSLSVSDTTITNNCILVDCFMDVDHTAATLTPGAGQTERNQQAAGAGFKSAMSDKSAVSAGVQSMDYTTSVSGRLLHVVVAIASVPINNGNFLMIM